MATTSDQRTKVSQLYVALFGRAPDAEGLNYWSNLLEQGTTAQQAANIMLGTAPAKALYPDATGYSSIVGSFYKNVLGREADAGGLAYWSGELVKTNGDFGSVVTRMIDVVVNYTGTADPALNALGMDSKNLFNNRVSVAQYYGEQGGTIAKATNAIAGVTKDPASVGAGKATVNFLLAPPLAGKVIDGYVAFSVVFVDYDGDGRISSEDERQSANISDSQGSYSLTPTKPGGVIVATGGTNIDTGLPNTFVFKAPATSSTNTRSGNGQGGNTLSPLSTLVTEVAQAAAASGTTLTPEALQQAESKVKQALGLDSLQGSLLSLDPVALATNPDADASQKTQALQVLQTGIQVVTTVVAAQNAAAKADATTNKNADVSGAVVKSLVSAIATLPETAPVPGTTPAPGTSKAPLLDLSKSDTLTKVLDNTGIKVDPKVVTQLSSANQELSKATDITKVVQSQTQFQKDVPTPPPAPVDIKAPVVTPPPAVTKPTPVVTPPPTVAPPEPPPVDSVAPATPLLDLAAASDSGASDKDGISNLKTPQFVVTLRGNGDAAPVVGDVVRLYSGNTEVAAVTLSAADIASGKVNITSLDLGTDGVKTLKATITDATGNASPATAGLSYTLDTTAPTITSGGTAKAIDENSTPNQVVYTATSTDKAPITGGTTVYSLKDKTGDAVAFNINSKTGEVKLTDRPDFEKKSSYSFTVLATDVAGNASEQAVTLAINNLDEVAPTITSGGTAKAINENSGANQVIYTATSTDTADIAVGATAYSLKAGTGDFSAFTVDSASGAVTLLGNPDFEKKSSYSFTVLATDKAGNKSEQAVTLNVTDVNEAPVAGVAATVSVAENTTAVGTFAAADVDAGDVLSYSLTGTDAAKFNIDKSTGAVSFKVAPNYEVDARSYAINVVATDKGGLTATQAVTLNVTDVNEAPTAVSLQNSVTALVENTSTTSSIKLADIAISDDALGTNTITLTGTDKDSFEVVGTSLYLKAGTVLDFETKQSYAATVNVKDNTLADSVAVTASYSLNVSNVDEVAPTFNSAATANALENQNVLYTAQATDTDFNAPSTPNSVTYSLKSTADAELLNINPSTGVVTLKSGSLDYESGKTGYTFTVTATDAANNSRDQAVTVSVTDRNDNAPVFTSGSSGSVLENQATSVVIYQATTTDADGTQGNRAVSYSLSGTDAGLLTIDSSTGQVRLLASANFEAKNTYSFSVVATNSASGDTTQATTQAMTVNVVNVNEPPSGKDATFAILRTPPTTTRVFAPSDFLFTDIDSPANALAAVKISSLPAAGELRYNNTAITSTQVSNGFEVSAADLAAGKLAFVAPNSNSVRSFSFSFQVRDDGKTANGGVDLDPTPNTITINVAQAPTLALANDTGLSASDLITSDASLTVSGPVTGLTRSFSVSKDGAQATTGTDYPALTADGSYSITVKDVDGSGNSASSTLSFVLDKTAPGAPTLALSPASDSGASNSDRISNVKTPQMVVTLSGTGAGAPAAGDVVKLYSGAVQAGSEVGSATLSAADITAGKVSITSADLGADGTKTLTATITDAAGNASATLTPLTYLLDTTIAAPVVSLASDTGISALDKVTNDASLSIGSPETGATRVVTVQRVGSTATTSSTYTAPTQDGNYTVTVSDTDAAGNTASSAAFSFTLDKTSPSTNTPAVSASAITVTANEVGQAGLYEVNQSSPTLTVPTAAATAASLAVVAQTAVTAATFKVRDTAGNFAATTLSVILGTSGSDSITGTSAAEAIYAFGGQNTIIGFDGADTIFGGSGSDTLRLNATSPSLNAAADGQLVGVESIDASLASAGVLIDLSRQTEGFSAVVGSASNDTLIGSAGTDVLTGGAGSDNITASGGNDTITGGAGDDTISLGAGHSGSINVVFGGGTGTAGSIDRVTTLGVDSISGFTFSGDTLRFLSADFGITGAVLIGSDKGNGTDGNVYVVTAAPVAKPADLNGTKNNGTGPAIVLVVGQSNTDVYFTSDRSAFSTANARQIASLVGVSSSNGITEADFSFA